MIALLSGAVASRRPDHVVLDLRRRRLPPRGLGRDAAARRPGRRRASTLHTHLFVRDDALVLYGFHTEEERDLFLMLLGVQSVGPKVALAVLSGAPARELVAAIAAGDSARALQAVPGIGKRTAERIIVELREKVGVESAGADALAAPARRPTTRARSRARGSSGSATGSRKPRRCSPERGRRRRGADRRRRCGVRSAA